MSGGRPGMGSGIGCGIGGAAGRLLLLSVLLVVLASPALAEQVVVNSADWRDVYTGLQYAAVTNRSAHFVVDAQQAADLVVRLGADTDILLITGREQASPGFRSLLTSRGYEVEEIQSRDPIDLNVDLALDAPTTNVVVVDDAYGFNAVSVASYAKMRDASVVFAEDAVTVVEEKGPDELLLYGHIPTAVYEELLAYDPLVISEQDRFEDNFALVERFQELAPRESLILTNGEFIEKQLIMDDFPVLFTGRQNVPDEVIDFIQDNQFRIAVLVGNALAPNANYIKDRTGMSIFIKFAQGRSERQYGLDLFDLPTPNPLITISQAEYDPSQGSLLVTYQNPGDVATYFTASFTTDEGTYEDASPVFVDAGAHKTLTYEMPPPGDAVDYTIIYGASPVSLELLLQGTVDVSQVTIDDRADVVVGEAFYDRAEEAFLVSVENVGPVDAYVLLEAADVRVGADRVRLSSKVMRVGSGDTREIALPVSLTERDLERNDELSLEVFYGQREFSLVKRSRATLPFTVRTGGFPLWAVALAAMVAAVLMWFVVRRPKRRARPY